MKFNLHDAKETASKINEHLRQVAKKKKQTTKVKNSSHIINRDKGTF